MENATHTSGPLAISRSATHDYAPQYSIYAESGNGHDIAIVKGDNAESDAVLFAAAPDMLAALEKLVSNWEENHAATAWDELSSPNFDIDAAKSAIAKAKGQG